MLISETDKIELKIGKITGFITKGVEDQIDLQKTEKTELKIGNPMVEYGDLQGPYFLRTISVDLIFKDSLETLKGLAVSDTLHRNQIRKSRSVNHHELKGSDPRWQAKYLWPGIGLTSGIAGIVSLFYLRSRSR